MIFKRYGNTYHSVSPAFASTSFSEIGFRRDGRRMIDTDELAADYRRVTGHDLAVEADGPVQEQTKRLLLNSLESRLEELDSGLEPDSILVVENGSGPEWPKARQRIRNVSGDDGHRRHFEYSVSPPLRVVVYAREPSRAD